jgi:hypothetical protein
MRKLLFDTFYNGIESSKLLIVSDKPLSLLSCAGSSQRSDVDGGCPSLTEDVCLLTKAVLLAVLV